MFVKRGGQRVAEGMATNIELIPARNQGLSDTTGIGMLLMEDNENALGHCLPCCGWHILGECGPGVQGHQSHTLPIIIPDLR